MGLNLETTVEMSTVWLGDVDAYDWTPLERAAIFPRLAELLGDLTGLDVVDLGTGTGIGAMLMASLGPATITALDRSPTMLARARKIEQDNQLGIDFVETDLLELNQAIQGPKDLFISLFVFEHLANATEITEITKQVRELLVRNGRFVCLIPHPCFEHLHDQPGDTRRRFYDPEAGYLDEALLEVTLTSSRGKKFSFPQMHRPLSYFINAIALSGLTLSRMEEIAPNTSSQTGRPYYLILEYRNC